MIIKLPLKSSYIKVHNSQLLFYVRKKNYFKKGS